MVVPWAGTEGRVYMHVCVCLCACSQFVGEECMKGSRMGMTGVQTKFCSRKFGCVFTGQVGSLLPVG